MIEPRNRMMIFLSFGGEDWEAIGKDVDELNKELNPQTENKKNVLGESAFTHQGYEPSVEVDTYYMDPSRKLYKNLLEIAMKEKYDEASLLCKYAEAHFDTPDEDAGTMSGICYVRDAWIVPTSVGGDTAGFNIPFTINPVGAPVEKKIVYTLKDNSCVISEKEAV